MTPPLFRSIVAVLVLTMWQGMPCRPVCAQNSLQTAEDLRAAGLESVPLYVESFGLSIHPPLGTAVSMERVGSHTTISLSDTAIPPAWSMRVQSMTSTMEHPTAAAQVDDHLLRLRSTGQPFSVLRNEETVHDGRICYLRKTAGEGQDFVQGWLVIPRSEKSFLVWTMIIANDHFGRIESILEDSFSTIVLRDAAQVSQQRVDRIAAGTSLLESLTPERLRALEGTTQWLRLYLPTNGGRESATEVGYSLVGIVAGKRGLLNPAKREADYTASEMEDGLVVRVRGRLVGDAKRDVYVDTDAVYWMAWDQSEEAWSFRATQRQGDASRTETETGLRTAVSTDDPNPTLTVIKSDEATYTRLPHEWQIPQAYLSQGLGWTLGRLLPRHITAPMEMSFYYYNGRGTSPQLSLRVDTWAPHPQHDNRYVLTTRLASDGTMFEYVYAEDGALIQGRHHTGVIVEPIEPDTLKRIWRSKQLKVGGG